MPDDLDVSMQEDIVPRENHNAPGPTTEPTKLVDSVAAAFDKIVPAEEQVAAEKGATRDESGRFLPGKKVDAAASATQATPGEATKPAAPAGLDEKFKTAPTSWKQDMQAHYGSVPDEVKGYLHQREQELQNGFQSISSARNAAGAILNEFAPYAEQLEKEGATPVTAIRTLLQTAHNLRTGGPEYRKAMLLSLADQYGVNLTQPLNMDLAKAEATAANLGVEKMYSTAGSNAKTMEQTQNEYTAFANDPANKFFPKVRQIMGMLVSSGVADNIKTAYDMAVGMHPEVRTELINDEIQHRAQSAKTTAAANMSVTGAPGGAKMREAPPKGEALRDTISRALDGL